MPVMEDLISERMRDIECCKILMKDIYFLGKMTLAPEGIVRHRQVIRWILGSLFLSSYFFIVILHRRILLCWTMKLLDLGGH